MHLNQIKSFITVSQVLNFTNAARQNGVPQSTISRQINDLEQQLGVKLFYRTKRDVRLTQEGICARDPGCREKRRLRRQTAA